jgi:uncharacterized protein with PIN domain
MFCVCGSEKLKTVTVKRNRKWNVEKNIWVYSEDHDARLVLCEKCHKTYWTETTIILAHRYNRERRAVVPVQPDFFNESEN